MILEGGVVFFVGIDGDFLVFGDGNCWLLCWSTFIVSDSEDICDVDCMYFFEWEVIVCWKSAGFVQFDWERNVLIDSVLCFVEWGGRKDVLR